MVRHILKNGTEVETIENHKIRIKDAPEVYDLINRRKNGKTIRDSAGTESK